MIEKYGTKHALRNQDILDKMTDDNKIKYGVKYQMQRQEIFNKQQKSAFEFNDYTLPNGNVIQIQGYEHFAYDILINKYDDEDLFNGYNTRPIIEYKYSEEDSDFSNSKEDSEKSEKSNHRKMHKYYPDIFIPSVNKIIEVKSDYTFYKDMEKNLIKLQTCIDQKYDAEIWIINHDGTINCIY